MIIQSDLTFTICICNVSVLPNQESFLASRLVIPLEQGQFCQEQLSFWQQ